VSLGDDYRRRQELLRKAPHLVAKVMQEEAQDRMNRAAALGIYEQVKRLNHSNLGSMLCR
jgi:hypothetical protein